MSLDKVSSRLSIPARLEHIEPSLDYVERLALVYGFGSGDAGQIRLALEEAITFAIKHFFVQTNDENENLELRFDVSPAAFHCTIIDQGLPFDIGAFPAYEKAVSSEQLNMDGLGIFLIRNLMDEMTLVNKGREGKEWHLLKKKTEQHINQLLPVHEFNADEERGRQGSLKGFNIRWFRSEDALDIARCAYRTYGYAYEDFIYYPEELTRMNKQRVMLSLVALGENGELAGHLGLYTFPESPGLTEYRAAFVNPAYRQLRIFDAITDRADKEAPGLEFAGVFVRAVSGHTISQRTAINHGFRSCGILLASFPDNVKFKDLTEVIPERFHAILKYKAFGAQRIPRIFIPERHREMISLIYDQLGRKFELGTVTGHEQPYAPNTIMFSHREKILNTVDIKALEYGPGAVDELKSLWQLSRLERNDVIYLYLNLENPFAPELMRCFEEIGFFFAGILPEGLHDQDAIILQYLNNLEVDFSSISLYCSFAQQILNYIQNECRLAKTGVFRY